jgi:hypothetical protein
MAKPKNAFPSIRIRLDPWIRMRAQGVTEDPRQQVVYDWYMENAPDRKASTIALEMLTAMLNGEMGPQLQAAVKTGDTQVAIDALQDLIGAFSVEPSEPVSI